MLTASGRGVILKCDIPGCHNRIDQPGKGFSSIDELYNWALNHGWESGNLTAECGIDLVWQCPICKEDVNHALELKAAETSRESVLQESFLPTDEEIKT
jgi:hypothetical protein